MAANSKKTSSFETHQSIEEQTAAFIKAGGAITQIARGVTGQTNIAPPAAKKTAPNPPPPADNVS